MLVPLVHARRHGSNRMTEQGRPWSKFPDAMVWLIRFCAPVVALGAQNVLYDRRCSLMYDRVTVPGSYTRAQIAPNPS